MVEAKKSQAAERIYTQSESLKRAMTEFVESLYERVIKNGLTYSIVSLEADWEGLKRQSG
jgi:predicted  nucleic acid-binding Zn-ribbon protein